jgi:hypothetical protein
MLTISCGLDPENAKIRFNSSQSFGCVQEIPIEEKTDDGILTWRYEPDLLELFIHVDTHCDSKLIHNVSINKDLITITLEDTVESNSSCICRYREEYRFNIEGYESINFKCYFKEFNASNHRLVIDRTLALDINNQRN